MKAILMGAAALSLLAAPAFAQSQEVEVTGNVEAQCGLGNQSGGGTGGYTASVDMGDISDANGFLDTNKSVDIGFGNVWCNSPADLSLEASAFETASPVTDTGSFRNSVDMIVDGAQTTYAAGSIFVYFGGATEARTGSPAQFSIPQEFETGTGRFQAARVRLSLPAGNPGNDRPVAGDWSGTVTLTVQPS